MKEENKILNVLVSSGGIVLRLLMGVIAGIFLAISAVFSALLPGKRNDLMDSFMAPPKFTSTNRRTNLNLKKYGDQISLTFSNETETSSKSLESKQSHGIPRIKP